MPICLRSFGTLGRGSRVHGTGTGENDISSNRGEEKRLSELCRCLGTSQVVAHGRAFSQAPDSFLMVMDARTLARAAGEVNPSRSGRLYTVKNKYSKYTNTYSNVSTSV